MLLVREREQLSHRVRRLVEYEVERRYRGPRDDDLSDEKYEVGYLCVCATYTTISEPGRKHRHISYKLTENRLVSQ